ncbi:MAG: CBS domain-containing protein [Pseudomonadota bacterium]
MNTVRQLIDQKSGEVVCIDPDSSVLDAVREMAERDIGSVLVTEHGKLLGILTERHYARNVILAGRRSDSTPVTEAMSSEPVCVTPDHTIDDCMTLMTQHRIRHLPVLDDDNLIGVVSIGDLVKCQIADQKEMIDQLTRYIQS